MDSFLVVFSTQIHNTIFFTQSFFNHKRTYNPKLIHARYFWFIHVPDTFIITNTFFCNYNYTYLQHILVIYTRTLYFCYLNTTSKLNFYLIQMLTELTGILLRFSIHVIDVMHCTSVLLFVTVNYRNQTNKIFQFSADISIYLYLVCSFLECAYV